MIATGVLFTGMATGFAATVLDGSEATPTPAASAPVEVIDLKAGVLQDPGTAPGAHDGVPEGFRRTPIEVTIRNRTPVPVPVAPLADLVLRDGAASYRPVATGGRGPRLGARVPPHGTARGVVIFELPVAISSTATLRAPDITTASATVTQD